jgi:hypothetical protein
MFGEETSITSRHATAPPTAASDCGPGSDRREKAKVNPSDSEAEELLTDGLLSQPLTTYRGQSFKRGVSEGAGPQVAL